MKKYGKRGDARVKLWRSPVRAALFLGLFFWTALAVAAAPAWARDPFQEPEAPPEAYDYEGAAGMIHLKALLRTDSASRAVLAIGADKTQQMLVAAPSDPVVVVKDGLRHTFRIKNMANRTVELVGENGSTFHIGVQEQEKQSK